MNLKAFLEHLFDGRVDLVLKDTIKPQLRERILSEAPRLLRGTSDKGRFCHALRAPPGPPPRHTPFMMPNAA